MADLTPAEALGRGLRFGQLWDFDVTEGGSIAAVDGYDCLGRDLAYGTMQEADGLRGRRVDADLAEEVKIAVRRVANRDDRISRIEPPIEVREADDDAAWVEVDLTVVSVDDERGEYVLPL
jgi:hypothetical protein